ncbi:MLO-like protein 6 isoform X2 [Gossypium australe]|uniref:MLO-like protein n=1 Tax=Gossypium australe TaxID=47621 RepID=A0A5B6UM59_9ROSI|nr:MLO-like protein 6 isoform X2 [Gossypium australe]
MAGGSGGRTLEETPTWAVAVVCFALVLISIIIEHILHMIGKWLKNKHKRALYEALEKIKSVGQGLISDICISKEIAATWHPCNKKQEEKLNESDDQEKTDTEHRRRLLTVSNSGVVFRRSLAGPSVDKCAAQGKVPFVSSEGIHQLHLFIFVLALFHVLYCVLTLALGRAKMKRWKRWEKETGTIEYQFSHDPERFRFARETSFGRRHLSFWTKNPILMRIVCFFRQFVRSVPKVDYLTLRHGFIMVIITKMGLRIQERGEVVKGVPVVEPGDDLFWFNRPRLIPYLINFVLFQNAFQLAFFACTWYEFGLKSCFHAHVEDVVIRISMGILVQILCSYVTLPLYALVTQMGSNMKPTIFNERVATALRNWHHTAKKHIKHNKGSTTPSHHISPVHLLRNCRSEVDSLHTSPRRSNFDIELSDTDSLSPSPLNYTEGSSTSYHHVNMVDQVQVDYINNDINELNFNERRELTQHEINIELKNFSFDRRTTSI